ncbi:MAG TPA: 3-oxoacyl-[acyl-carrier-protein] reductase [Chloroflexi bacterium]|jgi:3-oxoacyl-[acyl-carrier protein] reductase|nr:3-oxoacyl-[acyl-carrier-protein] reductase [Chloroflexota bacterium]
MSDLTNKVAVVTGGSRGIGRAIALELARRGCRVVVNYQSNADAAAGVVAEIEGAGGQALAVQADVSRGEEARRLVDAAIEAYGTIDIFVNNAGITRDTLLMRMSEDDWDAVLDTNLKGAFHCAKAVQRTFLRKRSGRLIQIGSVVGLMGNAGQANYAAAKAGLVGLTKALARELGSRGITVNLVAPGFIDTDMTARLPQELVEKMKEQIPLARLGQAEDVAAAVAFLASDEAGYITGQVLCVDGGLAM